MKKIYITLYNVPIKDAMNCITHIVTLNTKLEKHAVIYGFNDGIEILRNVTKSGNHVFKVKKSRKRIS